MKKFILSLAIATLLFASCDRKKGNEHSHDGDPAHEHETGTHKHEDGSIHNNHNGDEHQQEEFKVGSDSFNVEKDSSTEKTEKTQKHSHGDDSHKH